MRQRVFGLALGYEDLNDHDELRRDPLLASVVGKVDSTGSDRRQEQDRGKPLAGKEYVEPLGMGGYEAGSRSASTPWSWTGSSSIPFLAAYPQAPAEIVLDLDATDDPLHGEQEGRFFHGY